MKPRTRAEVELDHQLRAADLEKATSELTQGRAAFQEAERAYLQSGKKPSMEKARDAEDALKWRLEPLVKAAQDRLDAVRIEIARLDDEDRRQELEGCRDTLARFADTLRHHADEFTRLDKEIEAQVFAVAVAIKDIDVVHARAQALANELRIPNIDRTLGAKPDLANCALQVRRVVTGARERENRLALAPVWLSQSPDSGHQGWKLANATAQEVGEIEAGTARARNQEAQVRHAQAFESGVLAGAKIPPPVTAPATSESAEAFRSARRGVGIPDIEIPIEKDNNGATT
jgi:hypothetical protein